MRSIVASAVGIDWRHPPLGDDDQAVAISNSSSSSSLTTSSAQPASRSFSSSPRICAAAPTSTPQVGWLTISSLGLASISRPTMNFCRLPPDRLLAAAPGAAGLDVEAADQVGGQQRRTFGGVDPARGADTPRCASAACSAPGSASAPRRGRGVPRARSAGPRLRRRRGEWLAMSLPNSVIEPAGRARVFARQRGHQLLLAVARDAGDADDLAGAHLEADVAQRRCRTGRAWAATGPAPPAPPRRPWPACAAAAAARRRSSAATGWRWSPASGRPRR